jgi:hypothetical protein
MRQSPQFSGAEFVLVFVVGSEKDELLASFTVAIRPCECAASTVVP